MSSDREDRAVDEVEVEDKEPWHLSSRGESSHLRVRCGSAYLLVRKSDGYTEIGYQDETTYLPAATDHEIANWVKIFRWRTRQTFPWVGSQP